MTRPSADEHAAAPPLRHPIRVATLTRAEGEENTVRLSPDAAARDRIARFLGIEAIERMTLTGRLVPLPDGWEFRGQLTAKVVQACVITLEPVRGTVDAAVRRRFLRDYQPPAETERMLDEADLDPPEPLESEIDLGHIAVETLALSLDPWPRAEGAALHPRHGTDPDDGGPDRPFAELEALRARLARGEG